MQTTFRKISQSDVAQAAAIIVEAYRNPPWNENWSMENATARIVELSASPHCVGVGAFSKAELVGFAIGLPHTSVRGRELYIPEVAVRTIQQRKGIGTGLLQFLEKESKRSGFLSAWLVSRADGAASNYYEFNGYKQVPKLRIYSRPLVF